MTRFVLTLLAALLPALAHADIIAYYATGASLYARFDDASNTAVDLTEGSGLKAGRYTVADAAIDSAGLGAGTFSARILIGTAAGQQASDVEVAVVPEFVFDGTDQTTSVPLTSTLATYLATIYNKLPSASANMAGEGATAKNLDQVEAEASVGRESADMIAARVNAHRGEFYPNAKQVWVLKRGTTGLEVKNDFQISKGAGETLRVYIDFASVLGRNEFVETINSLTLSGGTATIVADSQGIVGNLVYFDVTGGASEDVTAVDFDVTTTEDQTLTSDVCEFAIP